MDFKSTDAAIWRKALKSYESVVKSLGKPDLIPLDDFYRKELPNLLHQREPEPYITTAELCRLMDWKLSRGKWRRRLQSFVSSLKNAFVKDASRKAFAALPNIPKAVVALTVLRGVGPATASAVLAAYAPEVAPFMSDEALEAVLGDSKDYSLKRYVIFVQKMQAKAKELSSSDDIFTPSDVERALWSCKVGDKVRSSSTEADDVESGKKSKRESTKADEVELNKKSKRESTKADEVELNEKSKRESTKADDTELNKKSKRESTKADEVELNEKSKRESTKADDVELNKKSKRNSTKADAVELNKKSKRNSTKADEVELNKKSKRNSTKVDDVELNKKSKKNSTKADDVELNEKSKRKRK